MGVASESVLFEAVDIDLLRLFSVERVDEQGDVVEEFEDSSEYMLA